jgi:predicted amidohydrolase YtcJ
MGRPLILKICPKHGTINTIREKDHNSGFHTRYQVCVQCETEAQRKCRSKKGSDEEMSDVEKILEDREKTHGDFATQSHTAQMLKYNLHAMPNWNGMPSYMRESLEMVCTKMARMGHGDWKEADHPEDGGGYFQLIVRELEK